MDKNKQRENKNKKIETVLVVTASFPGFQLWSGFVSSPERGGLQRRW